MMKIVYFTDFFYPNISGIATAIGNLASGLGKRGNKVHIFAPKIPNNTYKPDSENVDIQYIFSIPSPIQETYISFPNFFKISRYLKKASPDLFHIESEFIVGVLGIIYARLRKKPLVGNFHGYLSNSNIGIPQLAIIDTIFFKVLVFIMNRCDVMISPAQLGVDELKQHGLKRPIHFIPNCLNEDLFVKQPPEQIEKLKKQYNLRKKVVLYVGRMVKEKSIDILLKSFKEVLQKEPQTSLFMIGGGKFKEEYIQMAKSMGLKEDVVFTGEITQEKLLTEGYFQVGDVFATASTSELQPVSLSEAMFFGLPIVGVDAKGVGEMIRESGLLTTPGNVEELAQSILKVLQDDTVKHNLSEGSLQVYEKIYSRKAVLDAYETLYTDIITYEHSRVKTH